MRLLPSAALSLSSDWVFYVQSMAGRSLPDANGGTLKMFHLAIKSTVNMELYDETSNCGDTTLGRTGRG